MSIETFPVPDRTRIIVGLATEDEVARRIRLDGALGGGSIPERDTTMVGETQYQVLDRAHEDNTDLYAAALTLAAINAGNKRLSKHFSAENDVSSIEVAAPLHVAAGQRALVGAGVTA